MIEAYKRERIKRISPSTVNKELVALRHLFNKAILWGYLNQNPAKEVDKMRQSPFSERAWQSAHPAFEMMTTEARENLAKDPDWYAKPGNAR